MASAMFWPCETRTSTCRNFATISSGVYFFLGISVLLDAKRHSSSRTTSKGVDHSLVGDKAVYPLLRLVIPDRCRAAVPEVFAHRTKHIAPAFDSKSGWFLLTNPPLEYLCWRLAGVSS